jgi:hypothetical protein
VIKALITRVSMRNYRVRGGYFCILSVEITSGGGKRYTLRYHLPSGSAEQTEKQITRLLQTITKGLH